MALTLRGRRITAVRVREAYPGLDAVRLTPSAGATDPAALRSAGLTPRQAEVMALAAAGSTTIQIAHALGLSARSVEKNFERIYARLGVANRTQAVVRVLRAPNQDGQHLPL